MPADEPTGRTTDHANELDSSHAGEHAARDRIAAALRYEGGDLDDDRELYELADAVVAALPELVTCTALCRDVEHERDELAAEATRLREQLAAAQSTDLEGDVRDHLHGLADWDTPNGAAPEWLVDAVMGFVAPHVCARKQAEAERDTAQAAITRVRALHSPEDRGTGPECTGCRTHVTFTPYEKCKTIAALNPPSAPEKKTDHG